MPSMPASLWRRRRNPLKRRSDIVEAWAALPALLVLSIAAPAAGIATCAALQDYAAHQRASIHRIMAVVQQDGSSLPDGSAGDGKVPLVQAPVRWKAPDGSTHTGTAHVAPGQKAGTRTTVWADHASRLVPQPPTAAQSTAYAVIGGIGASAGVGLLAR
ncbi:hypothetical protein ABR737_41240 [Streptomyces sp. Edi2]|uniref:Rv1733c family protein n=1 Tax=Streptomyces sp. Edi2 TaxID=3162528 RepID=UPI0033065499